MDPDQPAQPAAAQPHAAHPRIRLQPFWQNNPAQWFGLAEGQFVLAGLNDQRLRFYVAVNCIPENILRTMGDLLVGEPPADAYDQLRARLVQAHSLTEFERMELLLNNRPLGGQKPSQLLADLLQYCPEGETASRMFRLTFLHRLPRDLRVLLCEDRDTPLMALAARADQLWAHSGPLSAASVNAVPPAEPEPEAATVAAVAQQQSRGRGARGGQRGGQQRGGGAGRSSQPNPGGPNAVARAASGLCHSHWKFGDQAFSCKQPCSWQGN
jgi:hypothetical protein